MWLLLRAGFEFPILVDIGIYRKLNELTEQYLRQTKTNKIIRFVNLSVQIRFNDTIDDSIRGLKQYMWPFDILYLV